MSVYAYQYEPLEGYELAVWIVPEGYPTKTTQEPANCGVELLLQHFDDYTQEIRVCVRMRDPLSRAWCQPRIICTEEDTHGNFEVIARMLVQNALDLWPKRCGTPGGGAPFIRCPS